MYLCKRKTNKFRNLATLIFLNIAILSCSFSPVNSDSEIIVSKIKFDLSVPVKIKISKYFSKEMRHRQQK